MNCIDVDDAYDTNDKVPLEYWFINKNTAGIVGLPAVTISGTAQMPPNINYPRFDGFGPHSGDVGGSMIIRGNRLDEATSVELADAPAPIISAADDRMEVSIPGVQSQGRVLVKTPYGWVASRDDYVPNGLITREDLLGDPADRIESY